MDFNKGKELIGLIVRNKRDKLKLTQEELSARISLDQSNLSNIENGKNFPAFTTFCALVEVLNIEPNEFLRFLNFSQGQKDSLDIEIQERINSFSKDTKSQLYEIINKKTLQRLFF